MGLGDDGRNGTVPPVAGGGLGQDLDTIAGPEARHKLWQVYLSLRELSRVPTRTSAFAHIERTMMSSQEANATQGLR